VESSTKKGFEFMSNQQRVAIVTGASSGIGLATARALSKNGFRVFGTSRKPAADKDGVEMLQCDVVDDASVLNLVREVVGKAGRIDLLVNNAGSGLLGAAEESSAAQVQSLFDVNVFGVVRMTNAVLPVMRRQGQGRIINLSSILGLIPAPFNAFYSSTKHAIEGYSESLDHEIRKQGIRASLVEPGFTRTSFEDSMRNPDSPLPAYALARDAANKQMREGLDKGDSPELVANVVVKVANAKSPKLRYSAGKVSTQVSFIRRFVPEFVFDKIVRSANKLPA
jgi:NAD(P)-dependent dehydrogenase (short-subunit alcohol dehydrogenase family)